MMRFASIMRRATALVVSAAALVSLAACGQSNAGSGGNNSGKTVEVSAEGIPASHYANMPMPKQGEAATNPKDRSELKQGGTFTIPTVEIGPDWNSLSANGNTSYMASLWRFYMPHVWDYSADGGTIEPNKDIVTSVEETSSDPETLKFTINEKAAWNDGTPITWKDFESTWKVSNGSDEAYTPAITTGYDQIASVTQGANEKEAVVTFSTPFYPYESLFQNLYPAQAYAGGADMYTKGWQNEPHQEWAAGPYKIESHSDTEVVFVPNEKWWGDKPLLDKVVFKQMESSASINAFKNGEIDFTTVGTADRLKQVSTVKDAYIRRAYSVGVGTYTINAKSKNMSDVAVRKAFVQAIDREQLSKIKFNGVSWTEEMPGSVIMIPGQSGYEDNMPKDVRKASADNARKTLEAAGYKAGSDGYYEKDGKTVEAAITTFGDDPTNKAIAQAMQKMAKDAGIKLSIDTKASNAFSDTVYSGAWDMIMLGWVSSDPFGYSSSSYQLYGSDSESNFSFVGDSDVDSILKQIPTTQDSKEGISLFNKAEKKYMELYTQIPWFNGPDSFAVKKGLANFGPGAFSATSIGIPNHVENIGWEK